MQLKSDNIVVFTDGASRGNPGPGGFAAIVVYRDDSRNNAERTQNYAEVIELGGREEHTTNNRMELTAAIKALQFVSSLNAKRLTLYADSSYLINGITKWIHSWQKNGWKTKAKHDVGNRDLWEKLAEISRDKEIQWKQVTGHAGVAGNARCDDIATAFADGKRPPLYAGVLKNYSIKNVLDVSRGLNPNRLNRGFATNPRSPEHFAKQNVLGERGQTLKEHSRRTAYSYVSMVDGVFQTHKTWAECEARVKGTAGAKYKKVFSPKEERALVAEWRN